jgi:hypothetical protein
MDEDGLHRQPCPSRYAIDPVDRAPRRVVLCERPLGHVGEHLLTLRWRDRDAEPAVQQIHGWLGGKPVTAPETPTETW